MKLIPMRNVKDIPEFIGGIITSLFCLTLLIFLFIGLNFLNPQKLIDHNDYGLIIIVFSIFVLFFLRGLYMIYESLEK
jgi:hypothetical protein